MDRSARSSIARKKLNAYTASMGAERADAIRRADTDDAVSVVIIAGEGRVFCAGAGISSDADSFDTTGGGAGTRNFGYLDAREEQGGGDFIHALSSARKVTIAAFNGLAVGVGPPLALRPTSGSPERARFGCGSARRGLVPEAASA